MIGRVVAHYGLDIEVQLEDGELRRVRMKPRTAPVVVGDRVRLGDSGPETIPRTTELLRRDPRGRTRLIAANLDVLGITISASPPSPTGYVDRAIVAARAAGIAPFLVINKCDTREAADLADETRRAYTAETGGIPVFPVSAMDGSGLDALRLYLGSGAGSEGERCGAFIGTSGVGKSSLLNALVPGLALATGEINRMTKLGRHVTTQSTLHALPDGGELIDTPGFRDFVPVALQPADLARFFAGFEVALEEGCRFRNCVHRDEPDCGVRAAIAEGAIPEARHAAYLALLADLEHVAQVEREQKR